MFTLYSSRCPWFPKFSTRLQACSELGQIGELLQIEAPSWKSRLSEEDMTVLDDLELSNLN